MSTKYKYILILVLLFLGVLYRLLVTSGNNFIFNVDNARDFVDVREMVTQTKFRLIGPTSGIEGVFNGPGWYYILGVPFILTDGNPYSGIVLMIFFWAIGGFYLLKLFVKSSIWVILAVIGLWLFSNYIMLLTHYSFNPNPVTLLAPVFVYYLREYIKNGGVVRSLIIWILAGFFFQFEMAYGVFMPLIILLSLVLLKKQNYFRKKHFILGVLSFCCLLLPQLVFDLKHNFIMTNSFVNYILHPGDDRKESINIFKRIYLIARAHYDVFVPTLMNELVLYITALLVLLSTFYKLVKEKIIEQRSVIIISLVMIFVPFLGYIFVPINVYSWHLGGSMLASILLISCSLEYLQKKGVLGTIFVSLFVALIFFFGIANLELLTLLKGERVSNDVSVFRNELAVVDYVYQKAEGKSFKVYSYLPSVIDYPYQYLFWWRGLKKYGYLPEDYAYLPFQPTYISGKEVLKSKISPPNSDLVFLIKEPDRIGLREAWENNFEKMELLSLEKIGPIEVEKRSDNKK